jgi:hypothetical protein
MMKMSLRTMQKRWRWWHTLLKAGTECAVNGAKKLQCAKTKTERRTIQTAPIGTILIIGTGTIRVNVSTVDAAFARFSDIMRLHCWKKKSKEGAHLTEEEDKEDMTEIMFMSKDIKKGTEKMSKDI